MPMIKANYSIPVSFTFDKTELKFKAYLQLRTDFDFNKLGQRFGVKLLLDDLTKVWNTQNVYFSPESEDSTACKINGKAYNIEIESKPTIYTTASLSFYDTNYRKNLTAQAEKRIQKDLSEEIILWRTDNIEELRKLFLKEHIRHLREQLKEHQMLVNEVKVILGVSNAD